ncbi:MAG: DUF1778 domain-containing protein [Candidatus Thiodiazotropha sp.]
MIQAAALQHKNLTEFVVRNAVSVAHKIVDENERLALTERDSLHVLDLIAAAFTLLKQS